MMNAKTGKWMSLHDHIVQCVIAILSTLIGTRLLRRQFGSFMPEFIDSATSELKLAQLRASIVLALVKWEKRLIIKRVNFEVTEGRVFIKIQSLINGEEHLLKYDPIKNAMVNQ